MAELGVDVRVAGELDAVVELAGQVVVVAVDAREPELTAVPRFSSSATITAVASQRAVTGATQLFEADPVTS